MIIDREDAAMGLRLSQPWSARTIGAGPAIALVVLAAGILLMGILGGR
jgi:hypothetical protein